ncbi:MAG TPA: TrkA family potassium uptake protein [Anaerolineaceae bacterium]|jgi:trk system potassium uptake protein
MFVIIVGGGKTGSQLAENLLKEGHQVKVIEDRDSVLERLRLELPGEVVFAGDGSSPDVLEAAGIGSAQVLTAVTGDDEANLVITTLARFEFHVPRVIARVNNPKNAWLFTPEMGVDVALNQSDILAHLIAEEMSLGDMMTLLKLRKGEYSVVEEKVHPASGAVGKKLSELHMPGESVIAAIIRKGKLVIPHGDTELQPADEVLAVVHSSQVGALAERLGR